MLSLSQLDSYQETKITKRGRIVGELPFDFYLWGGVGRNLTKGRGFSFFKKQDYNLFRLSQG